MNDDWMDEARERMERYFKTVSDEQLDKDLREAGYDPDNPPEEAMGIIEMQELYAPPNGLSLSWIMAKTLMDTARNLAVLGGVESEVLNRDVEIGVETEDGKRIVRFRVDEDGEVTGSTVYMVDRS
jgi:hypothetical protein